MEGMTTYQRCGRYAPTSHRIYEKRQIRKQAKSFSFENNKLFLLRKSKAG
jgi:hypothetical protein